MKNQKRGDDGRGEREESVPRDIFIYFFFFSLLSKIYGNRTIGFRRSRRQSWSMRRELHVSTEILAFRQTPRGMKVSYLGYFYPKGHLMA